jgi:NTP pyrophosphatase (non-canonical NTP hydrolase)
LAEEAGELCEEVLAHNSLQRKDKLDRHNEDNLQGEFADVLITTLLLAKTMKINVDKALKGKIEKINERYRKQPLKECQPGRLTLEDVV